jgi:hypothetical protein
VGRHCRAGAWGGVKKGGPPSASSERAGSSARTTAKKRKTDASRDIHLTTDLVQIDCNAMALPVAIRELVGWHLLHGMI